ncbi:MAG: baseplate J/gp47 family protein, partial [Thermoplasmata archaeon]|nr:baseplate J/gp47 family protein [Thermoplasmata archaeon]
MSFKTRTYHEIVEATLEELADNSQITDTNIGSVSRTLIESVAREISNLYDQMEAAYDAGFIETASSKSLDMVVAILGLERKSAQYATGAVTFSRRNPTGAVTVPRGTRVATIASTAPNVKLFETTRTVELPKDEAEVEAPVKALIPGEEGIADFETIAAIEVPIIGIDKVLNKKPTTIGTSRESDDEFRARAKSFIRAVGKATPEALKSTVLEIPGVRGATINEMPNEIPGEIDIIIDGLDLSSEDTLDFKKVINAVEAVRPAGIHVNIRPTASARLDARLYIKLNEDARSDEELESITSKLKELVTHHVKSLSIGENLVRNKIISRLFEIPEVYNVDN